MVTTMAKTDLSLAFGRYAVPIMPFLFFILIGLSCNEVNKLVNKNEALASRNQELMQLVSNAQKENSDLARRQAATELRARDAEKKAMEKNALADNSPDKGVNVIIINPGAKSSTSLPSKSYADLNYPL